MSNFCRSLQKPDSFSFSKSRLFPILVTKEAGRLSKAQHYKDAFPQPSTKQFCTHQRGAPPHPPLAWRHRRWRSWCMSQPALPSFLSILTCTAPGRHRPPLQLHLELCELLWPSCSGNSCAERRERMSCGTCAHCERSQSPRRLFSGFWRKYFVTPDACKDRQFNKFCMKLNYWLTKRTIIFECEPSSQK